MEFLGSPKNTPSVPKANILLVDDAPAKLQTLCALLEELGQNCIEARSGEEAVNLLRHDDFAVVVLDGQSFGPDLLETARAIRRQERSGPTPILFLVSEPNDRFPLEHAYALGAVDHLAKPLVPALLRAKIAFYVEIFRKTAQWQQQSERLRRLEGRELQRNAESLLGLSEFFSDYTCTAHFNGKELVLESVSEGFSRVTGYTLEEFNACGGPLVAIHPDDVFVALQSLERLVAGEADSAEIRFITKSGEVRWLRYLARPVRDDADARGFRIHGAAQDITDRKEAGKRLRESEQRFRQLAENIKEVFWLFDTLRSQILYVSPAYEDIWDRPCATLADQPWPLWEAVHAEDREQVIAALEKWYRGETTEVEYRIMRPDGSMRWVRERSFPIKDSSAQVYRVAGITHDTTQDKHSQAQRQRLEEQLQQHNEALAAADRHKNEFLATLAHELRNPLAPLRNALQVLSLTGSSDPNFARVRDMMERQLMQMVRLVDDLLDLNRISRGQIELRNKPLPAAAVIESALEISRPLIEAAQHQLVVTLPREPIFILGDAIRLTQIISNLLNNSAKYTPQKGHIFLTLQRENEQAVFHVRDDGRGISAELLPKIFEMFTRGDRAPEQVQGGLGIGLTLVRRLVEMHGGTVEAYSEGRGKGSDFVVRIPAMPDAAEVQPISLPSTEAAPLAVPLRRILVVDDNQDAADSMAMMLQLMGNEIRMAADGVEAIEAAEIFRPDIVLLDIGLPRLNGYDVAHHIRRQPWSKDLILIALTGWGQDEDRQRSREAGIDFHLVKPVAPEILTKLLGRI